MSMRIYTYIAGDWDNDIDAINQLHKWNNERRYNLSFYDVHETTQSRDDSLNCSIKSSLKKRMDESKTFVLIVGDKTNEVTKGACYLCGSYNSHTESCAKGYYVDNRSFIEYECDIAKEANIKIVVLYKDYKVNREKCPESVRYSGTHIAMKSLYIGTPSWDFESIKNAIE